MITEHKTVYKTPDGKLFVDKDEAERHEFNITIRRRLALLVADAAIEARAYVNFGEIVRADSPKFQKELVEQLILNGVRL